MLVIEVEFLTGVCVAAADEQGQEAEWPPHPDRLFQALVAAWGRNEPPREDERMALEWLERQDWSALVISASGAYPRTVVKVHVPVNDLQCPRREESWEKALRSGKKLTREQKNKQRRALSILPELRTERSPRTFPAVIPAAQPPVIRYVLEEAEGLEQHRESLERLAREVTYLGHSHTLVRVALRDSAPEPIDYSWLDGRQRRLRVPYPGRLKELEEHYRLARFLRREGAQARGLPARRRRPGAPRPEAWPSRSTEEILFSPAPEASPPCTCFDPEALVLRDDGGFGPPELDAFPKVAARLRDALLAVAGRRGLEIPPVISGHDERGAPIEAPHLAIVPMADVGWPYSRGRLMGLALVWPRDMDDVERERCSEVLQAFRQQGAEIHFGRLGSWRLAIAGEDVPRSLRFDRYLGPNRQWATVLPAVLDRYPKAGPGKDLAAVVAQACLNVGLPAEAVEGLEVEASMFSAVRGAPSVAEARKRLAADSPYRARPLRHLVLTFRDEIRGPLLLGAGRYRGLGLCLPIGG